jgi:adenosylcobinamide-phosphate synthase
MSWLETLPAYPLMLIAVVIVSRLLPLPEAYHPLTVFRFLAQQLAKKVNPNLPRSKQQQLISGSLAILVALVPCLSLLYALYQFSELPFILDALLLYCSLDWRTQSQTTIQISSLLQQQQLALARQQANSLLLRDTANLNAMGLSKAIIESLLLHSSKLFIATLGYFLLAGGLAALSFRLLQELARQWNPKLSQFRYFGTPATLVATLLATPALFLSSCVIAIQYGVLRCYRQCKQSRTFFNHGSFYLLNCASVALNRDLGGPAYYGQTKVSRQRFTAHYPPAIADIFRTLRLVRFLHFYYLLLVCAGILLHYLWLYQG